MVPFCSANSTDISTQPGGNIPVPVGGDFRPGDGEAVPPYFVYGKRIRRSWGGNIPVPVGADFRPGDGGAVPPYFLYGKRIRRSRGGNIPVPVGADFRPGDGGAVPPYFLYGKRIRRSRGGNMPDGGYIHMAKSLNTVPITLLHTGRCAMRSGVISAERDMVLSMSSSSASMAGTP